MVVSNGKVVKITLVIIITHVAATNRPQGPKERFRAMVCG